MADQYDPIAGQPAPLPPGHVRVVDGTAHYATPDTLSLVEAVDLVTAAIVHCRLHAIPRLLVDARNTRLREPPTLTDRYWMAQDWAQAAQGRLQAALVARPEHIDPGRFGVKACIDAGLHCDVFTEVDKAAHWLAQLPLLPPATTTHARP